MQIPTFHLERETLACGYLPIGVDEVGVGCLAGPVVAAAMHLPLTSRLREVRDSKTLSATQRERLIAVFDRHGYQYAIGVATVEEVDQLNVRQASLLAMRRAITRFVEGRLQNDARDAHHVPDLAARTAQRRVQYHALIDGWRIPNLPIPQQAVVRGDAQVKSIAAASIVAKVVRDGMMRDLDRAYPQYGFAQHKGYGTTQHLRAIAAHGLTPLHRRTFCSACSA